MRKLILFLFLLLFYSCGTKTNVEIKTIQDDLGKSFRFSEIPQRVVSLAPSITESLFFIHADKCLVGVTKYCDYPQDAKSKTIVGGMLDPNLEIIAKLNPDLILLTIEGNSQVTYKSLVDLGYNVFVLNPRSVDGVASTLDKLNQIFRTDVNSAITNAFKDDINKYSVKSEKKTYAGFLSVKPLISFNETTFLNDVFLKSGFRNSYAEEKLDYPSIMEEDLFLKDPYYLFVFSDTTAQSRKLITSEVELKFGKLKSVSQKRFFVLDENIFTRPGPRIINALKYLSAFKDD